MTDEEQVTAPVKKAAAPRKRFPLEEGHYYVHPVLSRYGHSGQHPEDRSAVALIQKALKQPVTGEMTRDDSSAVLEWQRKHKVSATGVVDEETWKALIRA